MARATRDDRTHREKILSEIEAERRRQDELFGGADHDSKHSLAQWLVIIMTHVGLAGWDGSPDDVCLPNEATRKYDPERYRKELIRVAAVAVAALEDFERKSEGVTIWQRIADAKGLPIVVCDRHDPETRVSRTPEDCIAYCVAEEDATEWQRRNRIARYEPRPTNGLPQPDSGVPRV